MQRIAVQEGAVMLTSRRWLAQARHVVLGVSHAVAANMEMLWFGALRVAHQKARNLGEQARVVVPSLTMLHLLSTPLLSLFHEINR